MSTQLLGAMKALQGDDLHSRTSKPRFQASESLDKMRCTFECAQQLVWDINSNPHLGIDLVQRLQDELHKAALASHSRLGLAEGPLVCKAHTDLRHDARSASHDLSRPAYTSFPRSHASSLARVWVRWGECAQQQLPRRMQPSSMLTATLTGAPQQAT